MKVQQCLLRSGNASKTVFLDPGLKTGNLVTLKDDEYPERLWRVVQLYEIMDAKDIKESHHSEEWYKKDWLHKMTPKK